MSKSKKLKDKDKFALKCVCGHIITREELDKLLDKAKTKNLYKNQGDLKKLVIECPECGLSYICLVKNEEI